MLTPSLVFAYWMRASIAALFYAITSQRLYDRDRLDLDQHPRVRQAAHLHHAGRRLHLPERLSVRPRRLLPAADVRQVDPRPDHVAERSARLLERLLDVAQRLLRLRVDVTLADERAVLSPGDRPRDVDRIPHPHRARKPDDVLVGAVGGDAPPLRHGLTGRTSPPAPPPPGHAPPWRTAPPVSSPRDPDSAGRPARTA